MFRTENVNVSSFFCPCSWDHQYQVTGQAAAGHPWVQTPRYVFTSAIVCVCMFCVCPLGSQPDVSGLIFPLRRTNNAERLLPFPILPLFFILTLLFWITVSTELLCDFLSSSLMFSSLLPFYFPFLLSILPLASSCNKATDRITEVGLSYCTHTLNGARACAHSLSAVNQVQYQGPEQHKVCQRGLGITCC